MECERKGNKCKKRQETKRNCVGLIRVYPTLMKSTTGADSKRASGWQTTNGKEKFYKCGRISVG